MAVAGKAVAQLRAGRRIHPVALDRYWLRTALAGLGSPWASPLPDWALSWPWGELVGAVLSFTLVWRTWLGVGLARSAIPRVSGRCRARSTNFASGGCCMFAAAGVKTGRGGAGHRHPLLPPWWPGVVERPARALPTRPLQAADAAAAPRPAPPCSPLGDRPCCPGLRYGGYRLGMRHCAVPPCWGVRAR